MSIKLEIETWVLALAYYDSQQYEDAVQIFNGIADTSKILFNCGVICATVGEHRQAVKYYQKAIELDQYLAIAYFQEGVSNFLLGDFEEAMANFNDTLLYLRGNRFIDYEQLGLKFRLYSCEVLFNRGLCYIYLHQAEPGMRDLVYASQEKLTADHGVIDEAIRENAEGYTVFSIPVGVVYRPNEAKVRNLKAIDYLGKSRLIAASASQPSGAPAAANDRLSENISYAATHLVQKNMHSRQHSEPPLNRAALPPTPPPEMEKHTVAGDNSSSTHASMTSTGRTTTRAARPPPLNLNLSLKRQSSVDKPRIGTKRTESEPRGLSSRLDHLRNFGRELTRQQSLFHQEPSTHQRRSSDSSTISASGETLNSMTYTNHNQTSGHGHHSRRSGPFRQTYNSIDEVDEEEGTKQQREGHSSDTGNSNSASPSTSPPASASASFETLAGGAASQQQRSAAIRVSPTKRAHHIRNSSIVSMSIGKFRIKAHGAGDTRYIMVDPGIAFGDFETKIRNKFGFQSKVKIKMEDEGDMITMGDQEDLDLLMESARDVANREGCEMMKMEIWVEERP